MAKEETGKGGSGGWMTSGKISPFCVGLLEANLNEEGAGDWEEEPQGRRSGRLREVKGDLKGKRLQQAGEGTECRRGAL